MDNHACNGIACLCLSYYDSFSDLTLKRRWCLDVWKKTNPYVHIIQGLILTDSLWFETEEERTQYIKDKYDN
jgi:hypothetical protein